MARAVEKRRAEFTAGRTVARRALRQLGFGAVPIPQGADRGPVWPDGIVGSITHCDGLCAAAVADGSGLLGLGIDAEVVAAMTDEVLRMVTSPAERAMLAALPPSVRAYGGVALFSAKESIHKALNPYTGVMLDFTDVELVLTADGTLTVGRLSPAATEAFGTAEVSLVARHQPPHVLSVVVFRPRSEGVGG